LQGCFAKVFCFQFIGDELNTVRICFDDFHRK
jgi:hypothetical protein